MKGAYDIRSQIAHGAVAPAEVSVGGGQKATVGEVITWTQKIIHAGIVKALGPMTSVDHVPQLPDWNKLVMDAVESGLGIHEEDSPR
jgi:hypothetical protein